MSRRALPLPMIQRYDLQFSMVSFQREFFLDRSVDSLANPSVLYIRTRLRSEGHFLLLSSSHGGIYD